MSLRVYTDAAFSPKSAGQNGAFMVLGEPPIAIGFYATDTTQAEITTIICAMKYVMGKPACSAILLTDSNSFIKMIEKLKVDSGAIINRKYREQMNWVRANWQQFEFVHIPSHQLKNSYTTDDTCNYIVDIVARKYRQGKDVPEISFSDMAYTLKYKYAKPTRHEVEL